jgi:hypothetical protein
MNNGSRRSYRAQLCGQCVYVEIAPYVKHAVSRDYEQGCDSCGGTGEEEYSPIYLTVYRPFVEAEQFELSFCSEHNVPAQGRLAVMSVAMPDRQPVGSRGPENTQVVTEAPW